MITIREELSPQILSGPTRDSAREYLHNKYKEIFQTERKLWELSASRTDTTCREFKNFRKRRERVTKCVYSIIMADI